MAANNVPATMRALRYNEYGNAFDVIQLHDNVPVPRPAAGELLVRQYASALDPVDYKIMNGNLTIVEIGRDFPIIPGFNIAGVVADRGSGCKREDMQVGSAVISYANVRQRGALAEYVCVPERICAPAPAGVPLLEASTLPLVGTTSWQALYNIGKLKKGESVLILGGTTATGLAGLQIARALGASRVACTCSERNFDLVRSLGATDPIDYRTKDWRDEMQDGKFDVVYDCVGGYVSYEACQDPKRGIMNLSREKDRHCYVTICGDQQGYLGPARMLQSGAQIGSRKIASLVPVSLGGTSPNYDLYTAKPTQEAIEILAAFAEGGERANAAFRARTRDPNYSVADIEGWKPLRVLIEESYPFDEIERVKAAFEKLMSGRSRGKQVIVFHQEGKEEVVGEKKEGMEGEKEEQSEENEKGQSEEKREEQKEGKEEEQEGKEEEQEGKEEEEKEDKDEKEEQ